MASLPTNLGTLGERLRWVREDVLQLGTHALAARLAREEIKGASNASVTRYEQGERIPDLDYVSTISKMADVPLDWIVLNRCPTSEAERLLDQMRELLGVRPGKGKKIG